VGRDGERYTTDLRFLKIRIFFQKGLDTSQTRLDIDLPDETGQELVIFGS
jgi:hypothetical protein